MIKNEQIICKVELVYIAGGYLPVSTPLQFSRDVVNTFAMRDVFPHPETPWTMKGW